MSERTPEDIRVFVAGYLAQKRRTEGKDVPPELDDNCDLLLSGLIDSIGLLELMTALQKHCDREIDFEALDPEQLTIVGPLCRYVSEQLANV